MQCFHKIVYLDSILIKILVKAVNPVSFVKNGLIKDTQVQLVRMVEKNALKDTTVQEETLEQTCCLAQPVHTELWLPVKILPIALRVLMEVLVKKQAQSCAQFVVVAQRTVKIGKLANVLEHSELGKSQRIPAYAKVVIFPQFTRLNRKLLQIISTASPN